MIPVMLIIFFMNGEPHVQMLRAPSVEACWAAVPQVAKKVPDTSVFVCVELHGDKSI